MKTKLHFRVAFELPDDLSQESLDEMRATIRKALMTVCVLRCDDMALKDYHVSYGSTETGIGTGGE